MPGALTRPIYVIAAVITALTVFLVLYFKRDVLQSRFGMLHDKVMLVMDSIGLGIFTVTGVMTAGYDGRTAAIYFCKARLCMRISCGSTLLCLDISGLRSDTGYDFVIIAGDNNQIPGCILSLEPAAYKTAHFKIGSL